MRNILSEYGYTPAEVKARLDTVFHEIFEDPDTRFYFEADGDAGYMCDTGNDDARTEGMSYGMMMAVQLDRQDIFNRLWTWSRRYMLQDQGKFKGYFAWSCKTDGTRNAQGPAPDGEEYYAMALFLASHKFGDSEPPFDYANQARAILHEMIHKGEPDNPGDPMFNRDNKYILFVPGCPFSDPSYHLPHFYELFALWDVEVHKSFWLEAAEASRQYLHTACHPETGLAPDYAEFNGKPVHIKGRLCYTHYSDSYRVAMNIGLDALWFGKDSEWQREEAERIQRFYSKRPDVMTETVVEIDGTPYPEEIMHPLAITATAACISAARPKNDESEMFIKRFFSTPLRRDKRRYYDNCLYLFTLLALSGNYTYPEA